VAAELAFAGPIVRGYERAAVRLDDHHAFGGEYDAGVGLDDLEHAVGL
jgi:hypothetical protein